MGILIGIFLLLCVGTAAWYAFSGSVNAIHGSLDRKAKLKGFKGLRDQHKHELG